MSGKTQTPRTDDELIRALRMLCVCKVPSEYCHLCQAADRILEAESALAAATAQVERMDVLHKGMMKIADLDFEAAQEEWTKCKSALAAANAKLAEFEQEPLLSKLPRSHYDVCPLCELPTSTPLYARKGASHGTE